MRSASALGDDARPAGAKVLELLAKRGCDLGVRAANGSSPLYAAAWQGHLEIVRYLLEVSRSPVVYRLSRGTAASWRSFA